MPTVETQLKLAHRQHNRRALTLVELLVVIAILGGLATGVVPSVRLLLSRANAEDVGAKIKNSWQLALATAQAGQRAVVWHAASDNQSLDVAIFDAHGETLWSLHLVAVHAHMICGVNGEQSQSVNLIVYPHGLADAVFVEWDAEGQTHKIALQDLPSAAPIVPSDASLDTAGT